MNLQVTDVFQTKILQVFYTKQFTLTVYEYTKSAFFSSWDENISDDGAFFHFFNHNDNNNLPIQKNYDYNIYISFFHFVNNNDNDNNDNLPIHK